MLRVIPPDLLRDRFDVGAGQTHKIAIQFILQQCCKTSCMFFARGGGGTPLQEPNGDVPLDGVAFSRLE